MDRHKKTTLLLLGALFITGLWGLNQYRQKVDYRIYLQNQYHRMFYELIDHVETIEADLAKSMVADSPRSNLVLFSDVWHQAFSAQEKLNQLPVSHLTLSNTAKFLTQVGDYGYSITKKNADGGLISAKDWEDLEGLHNFAGYLAMELQNLLHVLQREGINISNMGQRGNVILTRTSENLPDREFTKIEQEMVDYPILIYDGPFSEHIQGIAPKGLTGRSIEYEEAVQAARDFLKHTEIQSINRLRDGDGDIKTYGLEVLTKGGDNIYLDISRKGGHTVWMLNRRSIGPATISTDQAITLARDFLKGAGYREMTPTYSMRSDNTLVINFAYLYDDIIAYTDLIKVKVALDKGEVTGIEAEGFLKSHHERGLPRPEITASEAVQRISPRMQTDGKAKLTLIPLENKDEVLCYEIKGDFGGDNFLIYINALTGKEERILKLLQTEEGTLTI